MTNRPGDSILRVLIMGVVVIVVMFLLAVLLGRTKETRYDPQPIQQEEYNYVPKPRT